MIDDDETLVRITAPHFVAGVVIKDNRCIVAADIVRYMRGWSSGRVRSYAEYRGWKATIVPREKVNVIEPEQLKLLQDG